MNSLRIDQVIEFLEQVKKEEGDLKVEGITGFWIRTRPATGERYVAPAVGDGKALDEVLVLGFAEAPRRG